MILTKTLKNSQHVWGSVIYRKFNTNMTFWLKSEVEELTLILFCCTENRNKWIKKKKYLKIVMGTWPVEYIQIPGQ